MELLGKQKVLQCVTEKEGCTACNTIVFLKKLGHFAGK
jgi:hypothetical protein